MAEILTLSFTGSVGEEGAGALDFYGYARFDADAPGTRDPVTGERVFSFIDPLAVFRFGESALDVTEFEIVLGNNIDVENRGILVVDTLAFRAVDGPPAPVFDITVGVGTVDLTTFSGSSLPGAGLTLEDFEGNFGTEIFVGGVTDGALRGAPTRFAINPGEIGAGLGAEDARQVAYLYEAGLDRDGVIDGPGLNFWIDAREGGITPRALAEAFLASDEFEVAFGAPETLSDRALVEQLYQNVLERAGEEAGIDFWTGQLAQPGFDRRDLLIAFAESPENIAGSPAVADLVEVVPGQWDFL